MSEHFSSAQILSAASEMREWKSGLRSKKSIKLGFDLFLDDANFAGVERNA